MASSPPSVSPPTPTSPVSPTLSSSSSATATPSGGSTHTLSSLLLAATHVVSVHSLDVPSTTTTPHLGSTTPHSRAQSLLHRSRSHNDHSQLLAPPDPDSSHHRRFSLHRKHSRARSRSRHDASRIAHADFIVACEARVRERFPAASEEEVRRRVEEEVAGGLDEAEEYAREEVDADLEEREREEQWASVRAF